MSSEAKIARSLEEIAKELRRIRKAMDGTPRFVKCSTLLSKEDLKKLKEELKAQNENIILLPPGTDLCDVTKEEVK